MVILPKWRAELIINDLYRLDYLDSLNELNKSRIAMFERQLVDANIAIKEQRSIVDDYELVIGMQKSIRADLDDKVVYWKDAYKKAKRQKFVVGGVSLGLLVLILL